MKEIKGELFEQQSDAICITTNGFVKNNGCAVMGKGCAKQLVNRYPDIDCELGGMILRNGNIVQIIREKGIVSFPVKPVSAVYDGTNLVGHVKGFSIEDTIPGWACKADLGIITRSCLDLVTLTEKMGWRSVTLPRMGCGAGELEWDIVRKVAGEILNDRFSVITW